MAQSALKAVEIGASGIDINFGCPARTVNRNDGGASLLRYPDRIEEIVSSVRQVVPKTVPVSAKLRLGWDNAHDIFVNAEKAAKGGASWITIHARTRMQGYLPPVDWHKIGEVRKNLDIPVIANGDIWTVDDFHRCQEITGCDRFMLGRGAIANPFLALEIKGQAQHRTAEILLQELKPWFHRFAETLRYYSEQPDSPRFSRYAATRLKQWLRMIKQRNRFPELDPLFRLERLDQILAALNRL
jgi:tRNA-dihydrouridine synthase C